MMLNFKKMLPEEAGIPSEAVLRFLNRLEQYHIPMHSVHLLRHGMLATAGYYAPFAPGQLHRMFSVSKSLTALAVGKLIEQGKVRLDDPVILHFPEYVPDPAKAHPWIREMTIRQMLMMRSCHASTTYKLDMSRDWVESFFTAPPDHKPGTIFHYDTSATHTLCALVENITGKPMLDYLKDALLRELGFSEVSYMLKDPFGHSLGGSGLMALPEDMLCLGYLLLHKGNIDGSQVIDRDFVEAAVSNLTSTAMTGPVNSESQGYGYQIWTGEQGSHVCYGMGGQLVICLPKQDMVCVTTADTQGIGGGNQLIYNCLFEELLPELSPKPLPIDREAAKRLSRKLEGLALEPLSRIYPVSGKSVPRRNDETGYQNTAALPAEPSARRISGRSFSFPGTPGGFSQMSLTLEEDGGVLRYCLNGAGCELPFGGSRVVTGRFPGYDMSCASSGMWLDEKTFYIKTHILDTSVGSVHFQLCFGDRDVTVYLRKVEEGLFGEYTGHLYGVSDSTIS